MSCVAAGEFIGDNDIVTAIPRMHVRTVLFIRVYDSEQFSPLDELEQHVELPLVLKSGVQPDDEGVVAAHHNVLLIEHVLLLSMEDYFALQHRLECVVLVLNGVLH